MDRLADYLSGDNLAPNVFEFGSDNYWHWGRKGNASKNKNKVMLAVSGVQMDLRDVSYFLRKKQGFPGITDKGVMDIFLGGTGKSNPRVERKVMAACGYLKDIPSACPGIKCARQLCLCFPAEMTRGVNDLF